MNFAAPIAARRPHTVTIGAHEVSDPLFWLRSDTRDDPEVLSLLKEENAYADAYLKPLEPLRDAIYEDMLSHLKEDDVEAPYAWGPYYYSRRTVKGADYRIYVRSKSPEMNGGEEEEEEEVVLDVNAWAAAEALEFCDVGDLQPSPDHRVVAFSVDGTGNEVYTIRFFDTETREMMEAKIESTDGSISWSADGKSVFFGRKDAALRPFQLWRFDLEEGTSTLLFTEEDELFWLAFWTSRSGRFLFVQLKSTETAEYHFLDFEADEPVLTPVRARRQNVTYDVGHSGDYFYIVHNEQHVNFQLDRVPIAALDAAWEPVLPGRDDVKKNEVECFAEYLVLHGRKDGYTRNWVVPIGAALDPDAWKMIELPEAACTCEPRLNKVFAADRVRLQYSSLTTPPSTFDFVFATGELKLIKEKEVPNYDRSEYESTRVEALSRDGKTKIPISIVYKRSLVQNGVPTRMLLFGYGAYEISFDPEFDFKGLSLVDRGIAVGIAHIRGGGEMGRRWWDDGKMLNKHHTFEDFVDCMQHLVDTKWTQPDLLAITGSSAGGLLMGAVMNMAPQLCKAIYSRVPFLDVLTTMSDASIPLTVCEWEEWGNPHEEKYFQSIKAYSPVHNISAKPYPATLLTAGLHDTRVGYWEPLKFAQLLREHTTSDQTSAPILLKTEMSAGHGGPSQRYALYKTRAELYAFVAQQIGVVHES